MRFNMNGYWWQVVMVRPDDWRLIDRTGTLTVGTTDSTTLTIYISNALSSSFRDRVLVHELGHAAMFSYYLVDDIHSMVHPKYWVDVEEWMCNFMADYGWKIFQIFNDLYNQSKEGSP